MSMIQISRPQPKQAEVMRALEKYIAFGGARGGGKSWLVRTKAKLLAIFYPGIRVLILRRTYKELQNNHIDPMRKDLLGLATYNSTDKVFKFKNGSVIQFGYCDADSHVHQYQGVEYDVIFIDEATQFKEAWLKVFPACLRGVNNFPKRIYYTCNPGGVSHGYIKRLFIDRQYRDGEDPEDYRFIKALVTDNRALLDAQPDYIKQLEALPHKLRLAWLEGNWDILSGAFFEEWRDDPDHYEDRKWTHVINPFPPPIEWGAIYRSYDWGYQKPFSCGWWVLDFEGTAYRILEMYGRGADDNEGVRWTDDKIFNEIAAMERNHPWLKGREIRGVADPSIWAKEGSGISIIEAANRAGVYFVRADNERIPGWMQVRHRLQFDDEGYSRMYFFKNCKDSIRTMPLMMYDAVKPEDLDSDLEDHAVDEIRYFCMMRPIKPLLKQEPEPLVLDPLKADMGMKKTRLLI